MANRHTKIKGGVTTEQKSHSPQGGRGKEEMEGGSSEALAAKSSVPYVHLVDEDDDEAGKDDRQNLLNRPHVEHERKFKELEKRQQALYMPGWRGHLQYCSPPSCPLNLYLFIFFKSLVISNVKNLFDPSHTKILFIHKFSLQIFI
jgi:hypothetical protein